MPTVRLVSRRRLLRSATATAAVAPLIVPSSALGLDGHLPPSERIGVGVIGVGTRGSELLKAAAPLRDHRVVALCDCRRDRLELAGRLVTQTKQGEPVLMADFRELLDRPDVDAVFGTMPDHWHGVIFARAIEAGKDLYGEKPLTRSIAEGAEICRLVRRYGRIFQTGTQQRSWRHFRQACMLAHNGHLGRISRIEVAVPGGKACPTAAPCPPPPGFDYEMWTGPAPLLPYDPQRCEWLAMYMISHYCGGFISNWGVHHLDIAGWGCPEVLTAPFEVAGTGRMPPGGMTDTWIAWQMLLRYPSGLVLSFCNDGNPHPHGTRFVGEKGWVRVSRSGIVSEPAALLSADLDIDNNQLHRAPVHSNAVTAHIADFFRSVRTRQDPGAPVEVGHASSTLGNVCDIGLRLGRMVCWDPSAGDFPGDAQASGLRHRPLRAPWAV